MIMQILNSLVGEFLSIGDLYLFLDILRIRIYWGMQFGIFFFYVKISFFLV